MSHLFRTLCLVTLSCTAGAGLVACGPTEEEKALQERHANAMPDLKVSQTPYRCGGTNVVFKVNNIDTDSGDMAVNNTSYAMQRTRSASGVRYNNMGDEQTLFWTMGDRALLKIEGKTFPECVEDKTGQVKVYDTPDGIRNVVWVLEDMNQKGVVDRAQMTLKMAMDGNVNGSSGCNFYRGAYALHDDKSFKITGPLMGTRKACPESLMNQEKEYLDTLQRMEQITIDEKTGAMVMVGDDGKNLRFMME